jgi:hypothetical protein
VTITLPDAGELFMAMQAVNEDQYTRAVYYGAGSYTLTRAAVGTRYAIAVVRFLVDFETKEDVRQVHTLQDAIQFSQERPGTFEVPNWDQAHIAKLAEKYLGMPFWDGPTRRMSEADLERAMEWINDRFYLIRFDDEAPTIEAILDKGRAAVMRHGARGLVIDPYNEIEHRRPANMTETEYVLQLLGKVKRFAQCHGVHVWFVAHPAKMQRDKSGSLPTPTLYDISGSANWVNKADLGIVVHRDPDKDPTRVEIHVRKVRFKSVGKIGAALLRWDRITGQYSEVAATGRPCQSGLSQ